MLRITTRARVALLLALAALVVVAIAGSQLASAGSREDGGGSPPASDGGGGGSVAGICAAPEPGTEPIPCDDTIAGMCIAPEDGATAVDDCDDMVVGSPGDDGKTMDPGDGAQLVEPTPGMADVRPHIFDRAVVGDDGTSVTVFFWSGVEPCYVLDHVDVEYGANAVTITLFEGHDADAGDVACIEIALMKKVVVELDE
ncbi:MAG TPA: hypothetical protein VF108_12845, partial [Actinomycetota bacterium]